MLSQGQRLPARTVKIVFKKGKVLNGKGARIFWLSKAKTKARVAVVVSKKIFPKAVERNRLRRQVQALVVRPKLKQLQGRLVVIQVKSKYVKDIKETFSLWEKSLS